MDGFREYDRQTEEFLTELCEDERRYQRLEELEHPLEPGRFTCQCGTPVIYAWTSCSAMCDEIEHDLLMGA